MQGLAKGSNISTVGAVQLSWWTGKPAGTASVAPTAKKLTTTTYVTTESSNTEHERPHSPGISHTHLQEEEIVASGWGSDGDDGDGMGML